MKNLMNVTLLVITTLFLSACGGGSSVSVMSDITEMTPTEPDPGTEPDPDPDPEPEPDLGTAAATITDPHCMPDPVHSVTCEYIDWSIEDPADTANSNVTHQNNTRYNAYFLSANRLSAGTTPHVRIYAECVDSSGTVLNIDDQMDCWDATGWDGTSGVEDPWKTYGFSGKDAWDHYISDITDAWADGYTGEGQSIAILDADGDDLIDYEITGSTTGSSYTSYGNHGARMAKMAGGVWTDANGNVAFGIAYKADISRFGSTGSISGSGKHFDFISASFSGGVTESATGGIYDINDYFSGLTAPENTVYVTSSGNSFKDTQYIGGHVEGLLAEGFDTNVIIVTGLKVGNSAATAQQASRFITAPYVYQGVQGTSRATAGVAGMLALLKHKFNSNGGTMSSVDVAQRLLDTADPHFTGYNEMQHGQGKIDFGRAILPENTMQ